MSLRTHTLSTSPSGCLLGTGRMAQLCLVNEASLIRIRTLINSPAELSGSSRRLTSLILPIQNGRDEWSLLSRDGVSTNNSSDWTEGGRGKSLRGKATAGPRLRYRSSVAINKVLSLFLISFCVISWVLLNSSYRKSRSKLERLLFQIRAIPCRCFVD